VPCQSLEGPRCLWRVHRQGKHLVVLLTRGMQTARFVGPRALSVGGVEYTADHVLIAVGGVPKMPPLPGVEHAISSDGFFELQEQPKKVAVSAQVSASNHVISYAEVLNARPRYR
jgi:hypothetical protein